MIIMDSDRLLPLRPAMDDAACGFERRNDSLVIGFIGDKGGMPIPLAMRETILCKPAAGVFP
jgi:hypothetical protein